MQLNCKGYKATIRFQDIRGKILSCLHSLCWTISLITVFYQHKKGSYNIDLIPKQVFECICSRNW